MKLFLPAVFGVLLLSVAGLAVAVLEPGASPMDSDTGVVVNAGSDVEVSGSGEVRGMAVDPAPIRERIDRAAQRVEKVRARVAVESAKIKSRLELPEKVVETRELVWSKITEKCGSIKGLEYQKCIAELRSDVFESGENESELQVKKRIAYEKSVVHHLAAESRERQLLGRACAALITKEQLSEYLANEAFRERFAELFIKYSLSAEAQAALPQDVLLTIELESETVVVNKKVVLPLLLPALAKEARVTTKCAELVKKEKEEKDEEFKQAKEVFKDKWQEFKQSQQDRNEKLANAIQTLCRVRIKAAQKLQARGADANLVQNFSLYMEAKCAEVDEVETFEERKEILKELNSKWREFVRDITQTLLLEKVQTQVSKLKSVIQRANEAITSLEEAGASAEHIAFAKNASVDAELATDEILKKESLRDMVKQVFIARAKTARLVKIVNKVKNSLDPLVEDVEVSASVVASVPDISVDAEASTAVPEESERSE